MQVSNFNSNREVISAALTVILKSHGLSFVHVVVKFESEKKTYLIYLLDKKVLYHSIDHFHHNRGICFLQENNH